MNSSELTQIKQNTANLYLSRSKTVDSSFISLQRRNVAAYSGSSVINAPKSPYYRGGLIVNPIIDPIVTTSTCEPDYSLTKGYTTSNNLSQQEDLALVRAGGTICNNENYATAPPGITLKTCNEVNTIQTASYYNSNLAYYNKYNTTPFNTCDPENVSPGGLRWGAPGSGFQYDTESEVSATKNCIPTISSYTVYYPYK